MRTTKVNVKRAMGLMEERFAEYKTKQSEERLRENYEEYREILGMLSVLLWMDAITNEEFDFVLRAYRA